MWVFMGFIFMSRMIVIVGTVFPCMVVVMLIQVSLMGVGMAVLVQVFVLMFVLVGMGMPYPTVGMLMCVHMAMPMRVPVFVEMCSFHCFHLLSFASKFPLRAPKAYFISIVWAGILRPGPTQRHILMIRQGDQNVHILLGQKSSVSSVG
jgi:hypothetical protein